jgi:hypothetical protein
MNKVEHDILKKENEILECEHNIERKLNWSNVIQIILHLPLFIYYCLELWIKYIR